MVGSKTQKRIRKMRLLLLTLEKHRDGIWVTKLVQELQRLKNGNGCDTVVTVHVVSLESILHEVVLPVVDAAATDCTGGSSDGNDDVPFLQHYDGIINRVSDAADPIAVKRCIAILTVAKYTLGIPIFNGPTSYSLCCNKWCHHILFTRAKLHSPSTAIVHLPSVAAIAPTAIAQQLQQMSQRLLPNDPFPHLIKPNAGGFGNGIIQIGDSTSDNNNEDDDDDNDDANNEMISNGTAVSALSNDDTILLQAYYISSINDNINSNNDYDNNYDNIEERNLSGVTIQIIYRVWFLLGKVQCAVQRTVTTTVRTDMNVNSSQNQSKTNHNAFTSGCSASSNSDPCQYRSSRQKQSELMNGGINVSPLSLSTSSSATTTTTTSQPWEIPNDVRMEIEEQLLPLLCDDAHAGSVEFLIRSNNNNNNQQPRRYYFDLNLLSTLPINDTAASDSNLWSELARAILSIMR